MERMISSVQSWVEDHKLSARGRLAVLAGAAAFTHYYYSNKKKSSAADKLDLDFYSQLPAATDADGNENERWSW